MCANVVLSAASILGSFSSCAISIAAASVVAKVVRDRRMDELDTRHGGYGFAVNKGYGTAFHQEALERHGPTPLHRRSFAPIRELLQTHAPDPAAPRED